MIRDYERNKEIPHKAWLSAIIPNAAVELESFAVEIAGTVNRLDVACLLGSSDMRPGLLVEPFAEPQEIFDALWERYWGKPAPIDYNKLPTTHAQAMEKKHGEHWREKLVDRAYILCANSIEPEQYGAISRRIGISTEKERIQQWRVDNGISQLSMGAINAMSLRPNVVDYPTCPLCKCTGALTVVHFSDSEFKILSRETHKIVTNPCSCGFKG